jgi:putative hydrolase of the HAD superfamily
MSSEGPFEKILKDRFIELSKPMEPISTGTEPRIVKLKGIRAIIYDFYGTLFLSGVGDIGIDDGESDAKLVTDALKSAGINIKNEEAGERSYEIYTEEVLLETENIKQGGIEYPEPDIRKIWKNVLERLHHENLIDSNTNAETPSRVSVELKPE